MVWCSSVPHHQDVCDWCWYVACVSCVFAVCTFLSIQKTQTREKVPDDPNGSVALEAEKDGQARARNPMVGPTTAVETWPNAHSPKKC